MANPALKTPARCEHLTQLIREVHANIGDLPDDCRPLWRTLRDER